MTIEVEIDEHCIGAEPEEKEWLEKDVLNIGKEVVDLMEEGLVLHSNNIGDSVGVVTVVSKVEYL